MAMLGERLARGLDFSILFKAGELRQRILFTLGVLLVYRLGTYIPLPGIDPTILAEAFARQSEGVLGIFDVFAGGALGRMSIFALNIVPYISASIIMQLLAAVVPSLEAIKKDGESGRRRINQYARYGTVALCLVQSYGVAVGVESLTSQGGESAVLLASGSFRISTVIMLTGGTMLLMWMGEQITQRGIGNGVSLIIFAGIVANMPGALSNLFELGRVGTLSIFFIFALLFMAAAVVIFIVFVERAQRRVLVNYPKRQVGRRIYGGESSHLPLKINGAGVIPPIFASSLLLMPLTLAGFSGSGGPEWLLLITSALGRGHPLYLSLYVSLIVFFTFFYSTVVFNSDDTADNLKKQGGFIPGIRPGVQTADYLRRITLRLAVIGSAYLSLVCLLPEILISRFSVPFYFGGTSLLIVVSVSMDTMAQVQSHLFAHQYEGLLKKTQRRGGR